MKMSLIKSKFTFWVLLIVLLFVFLTVLLTFLIISLLKADYYESFLPYFFVLIFLSFTWVWLFYGEFRTKLIVVSIDEDDIKATNYFGYGKTFHIDFNEIDGYATCFVPSKYDDYEYLYLLLNDRKIIKISQFYHQNYFDLKKVISKKAKFLGKEKFSYRREFKEIFI